MYCRKGATSQADLLLHANLVYREETLFWRITMCLYTLGPLHINFFNPLASQRQ